MRSSAFANNCDTFVGLEKKAHAQRSALFKTMHFEVRRDRPIEPIHLYWNPETLLFEAVKGEKIFLGTVKQEDLLRFMREKLGGRGSYSLITSSVAEHFQVSETWIQELLKKAREHGFVEKEEGRFGKWYVR